MPKPRVALILLTFLLAACGQSTPPINDPVVVQPQPTNPAPINPTPTPIDPTPVPPVPVTPAPAAQKTSLGVYDLPLFGSAGYQGAPAITSADGTLKFEPQGYAVPDFDGLSGKRFVSTRVRVTNTGKTSIDHLTLLPVSTVSQDGTVAGTVGTTPFKGLTNQDGSDASGRAAELVTGQAGIADQYPATVRPDADASLYVQDLDVATLTAQAPAGLKISQVQSKGWRLEKPLAPGESAMMILGTSIPRVDGSVLPANYTMSVVAINDPSPSINPLNVKIDLSQSDNPVYRFNYKLNGEAVYMVPGYGSGSGSNSLRMITLAKVQSDSSATFNLPTKAAVAPFLSPLFLPIVGSSECTVVSEKASDRAALVMDAGFTLAEDFTQFRGLALLMVPSAEQTSTYRSGVHPVYVDRDVTGVDEYRCQSGTTTSHYKDTYQAKAGWNLSSTSISTVTAADGSITREVAFNVMPLTGAQVWTLNPSGNGGAQPPRY